MNSMNTLPITPPAGRAPQRVSPGRPLLRVEALLLVAVLALAWWAAWWWVDQGMPMPVEIALNGEPLLDPGAFAALSGTDKVALAGGLAVAAVVVPLALSAALIAMLAALLLVILLALALPLVVGSAVVTFMLSPLLVIAWLVWRGVRSTKGPR